MIFRNFFIELNRIIEDYRGCLCYKLHELISDRIDRFIFENILLRIKLNKEEFLDFLYFFNQFKEKFNIKKWKSREAMKCIKCIFENKKLEGTLFKNIYKLYHYEEY